MNVLKKIETKDKYKMYWKQHISEIQRLGLYLNGHQLDEVNRIIQELNGFVEIAGENRGEPQ